LLRASIHSGVTARLVGHKLRPHPRAGLHCRARSWRSFGDLRSARIPVTRSVAAFANGSQWKPRWAEDVCILLVEDEFLIRLMLAEELRHEGFDVCEAEDADHAIALIHQPPKALTLLITDIHMPGSRNGLHVASEIRAWHPQIPIIYATARPDALNGTVRPGAKDALLAKPFTPSDLMAVVRQLLNRR
jgi:CheY-like chemotaxis protein